MDFSDLKGMFGEVKTRMDAAIDRVLGLTQLNDAADDWFAVLPLRARIQGWVDRLLHGDRRDPFGAVSRLADSAHRAPSLPEVLAGVATSVATSLRVPVVRVQAFGTEGRWPEGAAAGVGADRVDEARDDNLYELELALQHLHLVPPDDQVPGVATAFPHAIAHGENQGRKDARIRRRIEIVELLEHVELPAGGPGDQQDAVLVADHRFPPREVVATEAAAHGWRRVGVTGTRWLVDSEVYPEKLAAEGIESVRPPAGERAPDSSAHAPMRPRHGGGRWDRVSPICTSSGWTRSPSRPRREPPSCGRRA